MRSRPRLLLFVAGAIAPSAAVHGTEAGATDVPARYSIEHARLEHPRTIESRDSRFRLESRLDRVQHDAQAAAAFSLRAKLVDASATACPDPNDIFSDSFE